MELFHAHHQWATRPSDQRFNSLDEIYRVTRGYFETAREKEVKWADLRVVADGEDVKLVGPAGIPANLTHFAFGQVCQRAEAPAYYLRSLPAPKAADLLDYGLQNHSDRTDAKMLIHKNGNLLVRAVTSTVYERFWNWEIAQRLMDLADRLDLVPARQTFSWGGGDLPDESERPAALYASDHDLWTFLMSRNRVIQDPITQRPMYRGAIVSNSEVGAGALGAMSFYFNDLCANHIIWGASNLVDVRLVHKGNVKGKWFNAQVQIQKYLDATTAGEEQKLIKASQTLIATTKDEVLDTLFGKRSLGLSRKALEAGYNAVRPDEDGDPKTVWGMVQGITRHSQSITYADERQALDRAAGKLLEINF